MARSRSSMTAEIFRRHGVWFGKTRTMGQPGGIGYNENLQLKRLVRAARPELYTDLLMRGRDACPKIDDFPRVWRDLLRDEGYTGKRPWGAKVDAFCDTLFDGTDHIEIGIWRNPDDIADSCLRVLNHRFSDKRAWHKIIALHHERISDRDIPIINTDEVVAGNHTSIERAFEACDLEYDRKTADAIIGAI